MYDGTERIVPAGKTSPQTAVSFVMIRATGMVERQYNVGYLDDARGVPGTRETDAIPSLTSNVVAELR